jgi:glycine cleavage system transcriptional repressor
MDGSDAGMFPSAPSQGSVERGHRHMRTDIVLTLTGPDRVGIVEEVTAALLGVGGNVESGRMARLGGEFAVLMLVSVPADDVDGLDAAFATLTGHGYTMAYRRSQPAAPAAHAGWPAYRVDVEGADHEGIIHEIAHGLSARGIQIESAETTTSPASLSGTTLFSMTALVLVPPALAEADWQAELTEAGHRSNVDVAISQVS